MTDEFSGKLDQRLLLQQPMDTADGGGGAVRSWRDVAELWAHIVPKPRDERRYAGHVATLMRYDILIRRDHAITLDARLVWRGQPLSILSMVVDPASKERVRIIAEQERER